MSEGGYVVVVKPSARRRSSEAGSWVSEAGPRRRFGTKALARRWARGLGGRELTVWVQDAHPEDDCSTDGYLLARRRRRRPEDDSEQTDLADVR